MDGAKSFIPWNEHGTFAPGMFNPLREAFEKGKWVMGIHPEYCKKIKVWLLLARKIFIGSKVEK